MLVMTGFIALGVYVGTTPIRHHLEDINTTLVSVHGTLSNIENTASDVENTADSIRYIMKANHPVV